MEQTRLQYLAAVLGLLACSSSWGSASAREIPSLVSVSPTSAATRSAVAAKRSSPAHVTYSLPAFIRLASFDSVQSGSHPIAAPVQAADGTLFGTTYDGGASGMGTVYRLDSNGAGFLPLVQFNGTVTGGSPVAGLIQGADGALYGANSQGGIGLGTLYRVNPGDGACTTILTFDGANGGFPMTTLLQGADGALYGTTVVAATGDGGSIFKVMEDGTDLRVLHCLDRRHEGHYPVGVLVQASDGTLFGTPYAGGSNEIGTIFRIQPDGASFAVAATFEYASMGAYPLWLAIRNDVLYGVAMQGGSGAEGAIFRLNADGTGFALLHEFDFGSADGLVYPLSIAAGPDGYLYGVTQYGGSLNGGGVFRLRFDGSEYAVVHELDNVATGSSPFNAAVAVGRDGNIYGTTSYGGELGHGSVFRIELSGLPVATTLIRFEGEGETKGVRLWWQFNRPGGVDSVELQRSTLEAGPWSSVEPERSEVGGEVSALDRDVLPGQTYWYRLSASFTDGSRRQFGPIHVSVAGAMVLNELRVLGGVAVSGLVGVRFGCARDGLANLSVLDISGRIVETLWSGPLTGGAHEAVWFGAASQSPGMYFIRLVAPGYRETKRVALVR